MKSQFGQHIDSGIRASPQPMVHENAHAKIRQDPKSKEHPQKEDSQVDVPGGWNGRFFLSFFY